MVARNALDHHHGPPYDAYGTEQSATGARTTTRPHQTDHDPPDLARHTRNLTAALQPSQLTQTGLADQHSGATRQRTIDSHAHRRPRPRKRPGPHLPRARTSTTASSQRHCTRTRPIASKTAKVKRQTAIKQTHSHEYVTTAGHNTDAYQTRAARRVWAPKLLAWPRYEKIPLAATQLTRPPTTNLATRPARAQTGTPGTKLLVGGYTTTVASNYS